MTCVGVNMLNQDERPFHIRFLERRIAELEEYRKSGNPYIEVTVDSLQGLMLENLHLHARLDAMEKRATDSMNLYWMTNFQATQRIIPAEPKNG